jgi:hypothetical protein
MAESGGWLYNASYQGGLQWRMLFAGIVTMMISYIAYRKSTQRRSANEGQQLRNPLGGNLGVREANDELPFA